MNLFDRELHPSVQFVGPILHHDPPLFQISSMVVGAANAVRFRMRKLCLNGICSITHLVESCAASRPGAMRTVLLKFDTVFPNSWFSRPGLPMNSTTYVDFLVES
ncbi:hypothetical protein, partial [Rhodoferax antarcticus]